MGAIILDDAVIESGCLIGAGAVVRENFVARSGYLYAGIPARQIKKLDNSFTSTLMIESIQHYVAVAKKYKQICP